MNNILEGLRAPFQWIPENIAYGIGYVAGCGLLFVAAVFVIAGVGLTVIGLFDKE